MSAPIISPQATETVTSLSVTATVGYEITARFLVPGDPGPIDPPPPPPPPPGAVTWQVEFTHEKVGVSGSKVVEQPQGAIPPNGTRYFSFTVASAGDYTFTTTLIKTTTTGGTVTTERIPCDIQTPVHITSGGGVIVYPPPLPPGPTPPAIPPAISDDKKTNELCPPCPSPPPCPPPVVLRGTFPSTAAEPVCGIVVEIYRMVGTNRIVDYVAIAQTVGSTLITGSTPGSVIVGNTFSVVFPPEARTGGRHYRLYLIGVLGQILFRQSNPVP